MASRGGAHRPAWRRPCDGSVPSTTATPVHLNPPTTSEAPLNLVRLPPLDVPSIADLIEGAVTLCMRLGLHLLQLRRNGSFQLSSSSALSCNWFLSIPSPSTRGFPLSPTISPELSECLGKEAGQGEARPGIHLGLGSLHLPLARPPRTPRSLNLNHSPPLLRLPPGLKVWFSRTARRAYPQDPSWDRASTSWAPPEAPPFPPASVPALVSEASPTCPPLEALPFLRETHPAQAALFLRLHPRLAAAGQPDHSPRAGIRAPTRRGGSTIPTAATGREDLCAPPFPLHPHGSSRARSRRGFR